MAVDGVITYTPKDEAGALTFNLANVGDVTRLAGFQTPNGRTTITEGRTAVRVSTAMFYRFRVSVTNIDRDKQIAGPLHPFAQLSSFSSHVLNGGEFSFAAKSGDTVDTTMTGGPIAKGATSFGVVSASGLAVDDWILIEDINDDTRYEFRRISNIVTNTLTLYDAIVHTYATGTIVRHREFFPKMIVLPESWDLSERDAGGGKNIWDLSFQMETLR